MDFGVHFQLHPLLKTFLFLTDVAGLHSPTRTLEALFYFIGYCYFLIYLKHPEKTNTFLTYPL